MIIVFYGLTAILTLKLVILGGLGVLNTILLDTRVRVRDIGTHNAIGRTPAGLRCRSSTVLIACKGVRYAGI